MNLTSKEKTSCTTALNHFDDFYKSIFKKEWPSVRLALLSRPKSIAVINNFADIQEAEKVFREEGAFELRPFFEIQKKFNNNVIKKKNSVEEEKSELDKIVMEQRKQQEKKEFEVFYPEGKDVSKFKNERETKKIDYLYDPTEATNSLQSGMLRAELEHNRMIMPDSNQASMYEFVPATQLRGLDNYIPESEYYKYYQGKSRMEISIDPELSLDFPERLRAYTFDRGDVTLLPQPTRSANEVYNFLAMDGAELLPVLALDLQSGDTVLHSSPNSVSMAYCILQSLRPKILVCNKNKILTKTFKEYLFNYSPTWKDMLLITNEDFIQDEHKDLFDKILLDVPCTVDKKSLFEQEDNIFSEGKLKDRLKLPELQSQLLASALKVVRPGGAVVYTTTTLSPVQNEGVVREALKEAWEDGGTDFTVKDLSSALSHMSLLFNFGEYLNMTLGSLVVPFLPTNFGPRYFCKILAGMTNSDTFLMPEMEGEFMPLFSYPMPVDIDDGIQRDIQLHQEIFGVVRQYGTEFQVMRFTLHNTLPNGIKVQVMSLGAALVGVIAPDRKGIYNDVVLGFDSVHPYNTPLNPGFGRVTSLCPLPYNLEKVIWDWDFDRDEGWVTFSTNFYRIDLILSVRYTLTVCNEIIVDMKACGSKIVPISLTSQVYWNMAGHDQGEESMKHHALSINSDRIWKHYNHKLKNFFQINDTVLDFRQPTLMDNVQVFGEKKFEHVYVVSKGCEQGVSFVARLIHPRSCRYVEIFSDQPWILCNTLNKFPRTDWDLDICPNEEENFEEIGEHSEVSTETDPCVSFEGKEGQEVKKELDEIPGKDGAGYRKYGAFCVTPLSDLTGYDPILRSGSHYSHRIIYKLGIYKRYISRSRKYREEEEGEGGALEDDIVDIDNE